MFDTTSYVIGKKVGESKGLKVEVVEELPQEGQEDILYLVPKETTDDNNIFEEWLYVNDEWEMIGTTDIDLSGYQPLIDTNNKLSSDLVDDSNKTNKFVTASEKNTWDAKSDFSGSYNDLTDKPTIPTVPTNVSAFTNDAGYLTSHQDITEKEDTTNKATSVDANSTDTQYPSAKLLYNKTKDTLNYKGHVANANLLPDLGQPNGTRYGNICRPSSLSYSSILGAGGNSTLLGYRNYKNYFLILDSLTNNWYGGIIFSTDYPEQISIFFPQTNTNKHTIGITVEYDANKPVYYRTYSNSSSYDYWILYRKQSGSSTERLPQTTSDWALIDETTAYYKTNYSGGTASNMFVLESANTGSKWNVLALANNIPNLKFKKTTFAFNTQADTFTNADNTYFYNEQMIVTTCPDGNYQHTQYCTNTTTVKKNDVYTVGDDNDIYRANELPQWEVWSKKLDLTTITGYDETTTQTLKNDNGTIKWVDDE